MAKAQVLIAALLVPIWLSGCAHRSTTVDLAKVLTLHVPEPPLLVIPGRQIDVSFLLHNSSNVDLPLCSPSGVTTYLASEAPAYVWPIVLHGWTTDTYCSGPFNLPAGKDKVFVEHGGIRRDLPAGASLIVGKISLHCDPRARIRCQETRLEVRQAVSVQPAP